MALEMAEREGVDMDPYTSAALGIIPPSISKRSLSTPNQDGWTQLMYACYYNRSDLVWFLVEKGADRTVINRDGWTALMVAGVNSALDVLQLVLEKSIINVADCNEMTALAITIEYENIAGAKLLLKKGANPNVFWREEGGGTPLMMAARRGQLVAVRALLKAGADLTVQDRKGKTAREIAIETGHQDIANLIQTYKEAGIEPILSLLGLEEYLSLFKEKNMTFNTFLNLTEEEMKEIGIKIFGRRRRLSMYLNEVKGCYEGLF